jgi:hypothetical protein
MKEIGVFEKMEFVRQKMGLITAESSLPTWRLP